MTEPVIPPIEQRIVTPSWGESTPLVLTRETLERMMTQMQERAQREAEERVARHRAFLGSIPRALHDHPVVHECLTWVTSGVPLHPKDHARLTKRLEEVLAEHESKQRHPSLWTPGGQ